MNAPVMSHLELDSLIPGFSLPDAYGNTIHLWDYKQKKNLVILFMHSLGCEPCMERLTEMARDYPEFQDRNSEVLVITREKPAGSMLECVQGLPFKILVDESGSVAKQFTELDPQGHPLPAIFVVDRFNSLYAGYMSEKESDLPNQAEILSSLNLLEMECPECGV